MTFNLEDIDRLAKLIMNNSKDFQSLKNSWPHYEIDYINNFELLDVKYRHELSDKNFIYVSGVRFQYNLTVKYNGKKNDYDNDICELYHLFCYIELDKENINCYLDFNEVTLHWNERRHGLYSAVDNKIEPIIHKYSLSGGFSDIYLSRCLYKDQCYYIYSTPYGIEFVKAHKSNYIELLSKQAALYRYMKYIIIFLYTADTTLIIIDTEHGKIGYWTCKCNSAYYRIHYEQYYSKTKNKLLFLSKDLESLVIIDLDKVYMVFNSNKSYECIGNYDNNYSNKDDLCDILCHFDVRQLTAEAITREMGTNVQRQEVDLVGHYIDTSTDTLYILAAHIVNRIKYVGLFSFRLSCSDFTFKKLHYDPISILHNGFAHKIYKRLGMYKIFLYRLDESVSRDSDMTYDKNKRHLVDFRYNRNSIDPSIVRYELAQSVSSYKDLIVVSYILSTGISENLSLAFIRTELVIVRKMTAIVR